MHTNDLLDLLLFLRFACFQGFLYVFELFLPTATTKTFCNKCQTLGDLSNKPLQVSVSESFFMIEQFPNYQTILNFMYLQSNLKVYTQHQITTSQTTLILSSVGGIRVDPPSSNNGTSLAVPLTQTLPIFNKKYPRTQVFEHFEVSNIRQLMSDEIFW